MPDVRVKRLAYITDLSETPSGGGSYAVNWHTQRQLRKSFELVSPGAIKPRVPWWETLASRLNRKILRHPGKFAYFSPNTLSSNALRAASQYESSGVDGVFFRSATRWCRCRPSVPYFVYLDVVFHTFWQNTFRPGDFAEDDLRRICDEEAAFLGGASHVFFESQWGLDQAREAYGLRGDHYQAVGIAGVLEPPTEDAWTDRSLALLTIAVNFRQKGGDLVLEAYRKLKSDHPNLVWHVIGGEPAGDWRSISGIRHEGFLSPQQPEQLARFRELLSNAFLLIHPTREDANPLVLVEAAYFGCPAISVRKFAIPELILDGTTGVLLDAPIDPTDLAEEIERLIQGRQAYLQMRRNARERAICRFDWDCIGGKMSARIGEILK